MKIVDKIFQKSNLPERENEIMEMILQDKKWEEIADKLNVTKQRVGAIFSAMTTEIFKNRELQTLLDGYFKREGTFYYDTSVIAPKYWRVLVKMLRVHYNLKIQSSRLVASPDADDIGKTNLIKIVKEHGLPVPININHKTGEVDKNAFYYLATEEKWITNKDKTNVIASNVNTFLTNLCMWQKHNPITVLDLYDIILDADMGYAIEYGIEEFEDFLIYIRKSYHLLFKKEEACKLATLPFKYKNLSLYEVKTLKDGIDEKAYITKLQAIEERLK